MALTLKLDTFDFTPFVRLQPGEEFDPGANPVEPMFLEAGAGEGQPLIGFNRPNKPMTWPLHVTPLKTAAADTKDGLHELVRQVNLACRNARRVEWRDDDATYSTFWDVVAATFDPDHSYWKARKLWLSGTLKVWTTPYGDTGTTRIVGSAAASALSVAVTAAGIAGDTDAQLDVRMQVGSQIPGDGRIVGVGIVPSGYQWSWGPGSMILRNSMATIITATNSEASQAILQSMAELGLEAEPVDSFSIILPNTATYRGRNRVIAVAGSVRGSGYESTRYRGFDFNGNALAPERIATILDLDGYGALDLGVLTVQGDEATAVLNVEARGGLGKLSRVLITPDESLSVFVDTPRRPLIALAPSSVVEYQITQDDYGQLVYGSVAVVVSGTTPVNGWTNGARLTSALLGYPAATLFVGGLTFQHAEEPDPKIEAEVSLAQSATSSVYFGHNQLMAAVGGNTIGERWLGVIRIRDNMQSSIPSTLACTALPSGVTINQLVYHRIGSTIYAHSRGEVASVPYVASTSVVIPTSNFDIEPIQAVLLGAGNTFGPRIKRITAEKMPSVGITPRNIYQFTASNAQRMTSASIIVQEISGYQRGQLPKLTPGGHEQVVGFALPLDGGKANDMLSLDVRVRERFTYAQ